MHLRSGKDLDYINPMAPIDFDQLTIVQRFILALLAINPEKKLPDHLALQKRIYLLSEVRHPLKDAVDFVPHYKGPYSEVVENSLEDLYDLEMVDFTKHKMNIQLAPDVASRIDDWIERKIPPEVFETIEQTESYLRGLSEDETLLVVYHDHPEIAKESVVRDKVFENRLPLAISLYIKGKVSLRRAAELANITFVEMKNKLQDQGELSHDRDYSTYKMRTKFRLVHHSGD